jgi:Asp-tRNA(Asn)/Glu-tRNA(Gln) amidotransferase B subunit
MPRARAVAVAAVAAAAAATRKKTTRLRHRKHWHPRVRQSYLISTMRMPIATMPVNNVPRMRPQQLPHHRLRLFTPPPR